MRIHNLRRRRSTVNMLRAVQFVLAGVLVCAAFGETATGQSLIVQNFPRRKNLGVACWSVPDSPDGYVSQIVVFATDLNGNSKMLWQSPLDNSYSAQIHFLSEITVQGLPLALVQRETGAASSELDAIGKAAGHLSVLFHADGFKFDIAPVDGSRRPFIIVHSDAGLLDVPELYRWDGGRFREDSAAHAGYYRELFARDRKTLPSDASAAALVRLARIAVLAGDRAAAKEILGRALARECSKGRDADPQTLRRIDKAMRNLTVKHL